MSERTARVAYVTKWAVTRGILVEHDRRVSEGGYLHIGFSAVPSSQWTEDKVVAEGRWRQALSKAAASAERKAMNLRVAMTKAPPYEERTRKR